MIDATRRLALLFACGSAALLAGCGNVVVSSGSDVAPSYSGAELRRYGQGGNELRVVVNGDPFGEGAEATAVATVDAMQGKNIGNPVVFSLDPTQEARPPSRVVVYLNPRQLRGAETMCNPSSPITTTRSVDGNVSVRGAWCQGNFVLSRAAARVGEATSLASKEYTDMIAQFTIDLFPPSEPQDRERFPRRPFHPFR